MTGLHEDREVAPRDVPIRWDVSRVANNGSGFLFHSSGMRYSHPRPIRVNRDVRHSGEEKTAAASWRMPRRRYSYTTESLILAQDER